VGQGGGVMQNGADLLKRMIDALLPNRAAPVLARVMKAHEGPGKTKYSVDVRVVTAGTLEDTDQVISEVPISPVWVSKKGMGLYAIPPEDTLVIIEFLCWNPAYPYVAGIWSDDYEAGAFAKDQFVITDGDKINVIIDATEKSITAENEAGSAVLSKDSLTAAFKEKAKVKLEDKKVTATDGKTQVILNDGKASIKNDSQSLFTILDTFFQNLSAMKTVGSPAQHTVFPDDITKIQKTKTDFGQLMEA
jgi:hypothetical protein